MAMGPISSSEKDSCPYAANTRYRHGWGKSFDKLAAEQVLLGM